MENKDRMEEIELREIFSIIRRHKKILVILPLVAMLTSAIYSYFLMEPPNYRTSTTIMVNMKVPGTDSVVVDSTTIRFNRELVTTYKELATSRKITEEVRDVIKEETGIEEISSSASVQAVGDTELMEITVQDKSPEMAALYANVLAQVFAQEIPNIMNIDNVRIVDEALVPSSPESQNQQLNIIIAAIVGLMTGLGVIFLIEFLDNTYKRPEDIKRELDLPVLGTIPDQNMKY